MCHNRRENNDPAKALAECNCDQSAGLVKLYEEITDTCDDLATAIKGQLDAAKKAADKEECKKKLAM